MASRGTTSGTALLLVDFLHLLLPDGGPHLVRTALKAARNTALLKAQARRHGVAVIYANDNFGNWRADFPSLVAACLQQRGSACELARILQPAPEDFSILKPRHSAFYGTPLEFLLDELRVRRLILAGIEADVCVMYTAHDAYMRKYALWVPRNCVAARSGARLEAALTMMQSNQKAVTRPAGRRTRLDAALSL
jgi:nicotinamidase-related amidase